MRKDGYDERVWNNVAKNTFANCQIKNWLNSTYKSLFSAKVQALMGSTTIRHTVGNEDGSVTTLSLAVFLLSATELGRSSGVLNVEGTKLPIAGALQKANIDGRPVYQWTRSPFLSSYSVVCRLDTVGNVNGGNLPSDVAAHLPTFTLPSTATVNDVTMALVED